MAVKQKELLRLDAGTVMSALMELQFSTPNRVDELLTELGPLFDSVYAEIIGVLTISGQPDNAAIDFVQAAHRLRRDANIKRAMQGIVNSYPERLGRKVFAMQSRIYRETLKGIAKVWNANTPKGVEVEYKAVGSDLESIRRMPVDGLTVKEWAEISGAQLASRMLAILTLRRAKERGGFEAGYRLAVKRIKQAIETQKKDVLQVAATAVNMASQRAFEQESELFA